MSQSKCMFYSSLAYDAPEEAHELDFRFEYFPHEDAFLLVHHGVTLHELLEECGDGVLGSMYYLFEMFHPVSFEEITQRGNFEKFFRVSPSAITERYLQLNYEKLESFFNHVNSSNFLDCGIIGSLGEPPTEREIESIVKTRDLPSGLSSILHTHDNHFLWLKARSLDLLKKLIHASLIGFFHQIHPHEYKTIPENLIDFVMTKYHTASLICYPRDVQIDDEKIQALVETSISHWTSSRLNPPQNLLGKGLLISYSFKEDVWEFKEWN